MLAPTRATVRAFLMVSGQLSICRGHVAGNGAAFLYAVRSCGSESCRLHVMTVVLSGETCAWFWRILVLSHAIA